MKIRITYKRNDNRKLFAFFNGICIVEINAKQSGTIPVTVESDGKAKYEITYISGNDGSVYVDSDGNYYGIRRGSSTVTCIAADEYGNVFTDTCTVTVNYTFGQWLIIILLFGWIWYI